MTDHNPALEPDPVPDPNGADALRPVLPPEPGPPEPATYEVVGPNEVLGHQPGAIFTEAIPSEQEAFLIEGGHLEKKAEESLDDLTRPELDSLASDAGVDEPQKLPNKGAVIEAIEAARLPAPEPPEET